MDSFNCFGFHYDLTNAERLVKDRQPNGTFIVASVDPYIGLVVINMQHVKKVDVNKPIIVIGRRFGATRSYYELPIDGWHRICRARQLGIIALPMHFLAGDDERMLRVKEGK